MLVDCELGTTAIWQNKADWKKQRFRVQAARGSIEGERAEPASAILAEQTQSEKRNDFNNLR
jgi:hypothetical protein